MSTPQETDSNDPRTELLKSIATSLKGIHTSLESLTAAVEDVSETIEKAHEPEGDLGVRLVGALKDLTSAMHKRAQQERSHQPQQGEHRQNGPGGRRGDHRQHHQDSRGHHDDQERSGHAEDTGDEQEEPLAPVEGIAAAPEASASQGQGQQQRKKGGRGRGRRSSSPSKGQSP